MTKVANKDTVQGVVIGVVISRSSSGVPLVAFAANLSDTPLEAKSTVAISAEDIGQEVALLFEGGDVQKPLIIGLMHSSGEKIQSETTDQYRNDSHGLWTPSETTELVVDGESMRVNAKKEIVLKCGKASITLTSSGKVILRGAYVSTRSSGVNRIKGGSVQIN